MKSDSGRAFTLLEVILAMIVFLSVLVLVLGVWPAYARAYSKSGRYLAGAYLAQQEMERTLALGFSGAADRAGTIQLSGKVKGQPVSTDYTYSVQVSPEVVNGRNDVLKNIVVRVRFRDTDDRLREIRLDSMLSSL